MRRTDAFYQLKYFIVIFFISMKFPLENMEKERDSSIPSWRGLADEALVWGVRGHLGQKFSSCLPWNYTEHKAQSGLFPRPHMQVYFNAEMDFWHNFSFWRTLRNSYFFCNVEENLILKLVKFLWKKLLLPDQTVVLVSSRYTPTNCMECIKIKTLFVAHKNDTLCRFS